MAAPDPVLKGAVPLVCRQDEATRSTARQRCRNVIRESLASWWQRSGTFVVFCTLDKWNWACAKTS